MRIIYNSDLDRYEILSENGVVLAHRGTLRLAKGLLVKLKGSNVENDNLSPGEENNMNENDNNWPVQRVTLGGFTTGTVRLSTGWVGQISGGNNNSAWDSEPFAEREEALKAANDKLEEKLKAIFA